MPIDREILDYLVCPVTKESLVYDHEKQELISVSGKRRYPVVDGIPVLLVDEPLYEKP